MKAQLLNSEKIGNCWFNDMAMDRWLAYAYLGKIHILNAHKTKMVL
jgi:hypothetical protein